jgi:hypothetical protein
LGRPISKNSVLGGLSIRRFAYIHEEPSAIAILRKETFLQNLLEEKEIES